VIRTSFDRMAMPTGTYLPKMAVCSGFAETGRKRFAELDITMYMALYLLHVPLLNFSASLINIVSLKTCNNIYCSRNVHCYLRNKNTRDIFQIQLVYRRIKSESSLRPGRDSNVRYCDFGN
jgi:hypothetical protein